METGYLDMSPKTPVEASPCPAHPKWPCPIRPVSVIFLLWVLYKTRKNKTGQEWNHILVPNNQSGLDPSYPGFLCHLALTGELMASSGSAVSCLFVKPVLLPCPVQHRQSNCFKCRLNFFIVKNYTIPEIVQWIIIESVTFYCRGFVLAEYLVRKQSCHDLVHTLLHYISFDI